MENGGTFPDGEMNGERKSELEISSIRTPKLLAFLIVTIVDFLSLKPSLAHVRF